MDKQGILSTEELLNKHNIQTKFLTKNTRKFERYAVGKSECGARTMNCIGYDMDENPELFMPIMNGKEPVRKTYEKPQQAYCICGHSSNTICLTKHIDTGNVLWVGTDCIEKNREKVLEEYERIKEKLEKAKSNADIKLADIEKLEELHLRLYNVKLEYDLFHKWETDKNKTKCFDKECGVLLYLKSGKHGAKNRNNATDLYCFKCVEKNLAPNCVCCGKKIFCKDVYNEDNTKEHLYKLDYCDDCGNGYKLHTFTSNIDFSNVIYSDVVKKNKIVGFDDNNGNLKWGVRGHLLKLPCNIRVNILGSKNYDSQEEDPNWEDCEFYKYDINDDLLKNND
jgi:hypothetical protein